MNNGKKVASSGKNIKSWEDLKEDISIKPAGFLTVALPFNSRLTKIVAKKGKTEWLSVFSKISEFRVCEQEKATSAHAPVTFPISACEFRYRK